MNDGGRREQGVRLYLCECGPIIKDAIDLDQLQARLAELPGVAAVQRHATLCSEGGREWMTRDLAETGEGPVVVAGCSPREHGATFMKVCRAAGHNPFLLAMANIREQGTWVTPDRAQAVAKAEVITRAAVARALKQQPLNEQEIDANTDVLVIGSGVAGLTAAQLLAAADRKVYLVERSPAIGGRTALLGDVYPALECASCMLEPLMDEVLHHPQIEVLTYSEVEEVLGYFGHFTARIRKRARHVDPDGCYGCRTCHDVCPVTVPNAADSDLIERKALYIPYEGALPNATLVDTASCLHFNGGDCDACVSACPFAAIDLGGADEIVERQVGAVIVATGAEPEPLDEDARAAGVIDGMTLERLLNSAGPTGGEVRLPGGEPPRSIAFIHCADSSGVAPVEECSKLCCMSIAKYIHQLHEKLPDCRIHQLMWERCVGGKEYRQFANDAERLPGVELHRLHAGDRVEGVSEEGGRAQITYVRGGRTETLDVDLVVISPPLLGAAGVDRLAGGLRVVLDRERFVVEEHERLRPFRTRVEGVLVAGCARGPGDIQDAAAQGAAAAGSALAALVPGRKLKVEAIVAEVREDTCGGCHTCVITCPYQAITFDAEQRVSAVNELLCRGCGSCVAACPNGAILQRNFTDEQLDAEIGAYML